jgi:hypothetical protein
MAKLSYAALRCHERFQGWLANRWSMNTDDTKSAQVQFEHWFKGKTEGLMKDHESSVETIKKGSFETTCRVWKTQKRSASSMEMNESEEALNDNAKIDVNSEGS